VGQLKCRLALKRKRAHDSHTSLQRETW
jgi:hypothetical protein